MWSWRTIRVLRRCGRDLKASREVRLQPWARVEGTLRIGNKPGTDEAIRLASAFPPSYPRLLPPCLVSNETTTDGAGDLSFRVCHRGYQAFSSYENGPGESGLVPISQITNLTLCGGETRSVTLAARGARSLARRLEELLQPIGWQDQVFWLETKLPDCPQIDAIRNEYHAA